MKYGLLTLIIAAFLLLTFDTANAANCTACCRQGAHNCFSGVAEPTSRDQSEESIRQINDHATQEFVAQQIFWISLFWEDNLLPSLMLMSEQLTAVAMKQVEIIGGFFDAKHQMETQQLLQQKRARAHKDYHPSTGMCEFGSSVKSLAASERLGEINAVVMAQRSLDRNLQNANTVGSGGISGDLKSRLRQFRMHYCNPQDNNGGMTFICERDHHGNVGAIDPMRMNKDIDYLRTIDMPWTLDVNFTNSSGGVTEHEEDVLALATNLYGPDIMEYYPTLEDGGNSVITEEQTEYMDARAMLAKRNVAENSYNAIVGMKSAGTAGSRDYLQALLAELGIEDSSTAVKTSTGEKSQLDALLGDNPSYHAQMEVLTKKIFQNPDFYTNLYDKPANVERKGVALQAIGLMQKFDLLKSYLRNEATLSILLELAVMDVQEDIESKLVSGTSLSGARADPN